METVVINRHSLTFKMQIQRINVFSLSRFSTEIAAVKTGLILLIVGNKRIIEYIEEEDKFKEINKGSEEKTKY